MSSPFDPIDSNEQQTTFAVLTPRGLFTGMLYFGVLPQKCARGPRQYPSWGYGTSDGSPNLTGTNRPSRPAEEPSEAFGLLPEGGVPNHAEVYKTSFEAIGDFKFSESRSEMILYG